MSKLLNVRDEIVSKLDKLREEDKMSYSEVINMLLMHYAATNEDDLSTTDIN